MSIEGGIISDENKNNESIEKLKDEERAQNSTTTTPL
jgi:hypothetical protein